MTEAYLIYIGKGASIYGVPARDLTYDEAFIAGEKRLIDSKLYKYAKEQRKVELSKRKSKKETDNG